MVRMTVAVSNVTHTVLAKGGGSERVSAVTVDLRGDATAEGEGGQGVVVCEEDNSVDHLGQGPAVFLRLQKALQQKIQWKKKIIQSHE